MTALGTVACLELNDGKIVWSRMATGLKKSATDWLYCSPRLYGDVLLTCFGGLMWNNNRLIAWDKRNGKKLWDRPSEPAKRWGEGTHGGNMAVLQLPDGKDPAAPLTPTSVRLACDRRSDVPAPAGPLSGETMAAS